MAVLPTQVTPASDRVTSSVAHQAHEPGTGHAHRLLSPLTKNTWQDIENVIVAARQAAGEVKSRYRLEALRAATKEQLLEAMTKGAREDAVATRSGKSAHDLVEVRTDDPALLDLTHALLSRARGSDDGYTAVKLDDAAAAVAWEAVVAPLGNRDNLPWMEEGALVPAWWAPVKASLGGAAGAVAQTVSAGMRALKSVLWDKCRGLRDSMRASMREPTREPLSPTSPQDCGPFNLTDEQEKAAEDESVPGSGSSSSAVKEAEPPRRGINVHDVTVKHPENPWAGLTLGAHMTHRQGRDVRGAIQAFFGIACSPEVLDDLASEAVGREAIGDLVKELAARAWTAQGPHAHRRGAAWMAFHDGRSLESRLAQAPRLDRLLLVSGEGNVVVALARLEGEPPAWVRLDRQPPQVVQPGTLLEALADDDELGEVYGMANGAWPEHDDVSEPSSDSDAGSTLQAPSSRFASELNTRQRSMLTSFHPARSPGALRKAVAVEAKDVAFETFDNPSWGKGKAAGYSACAAVQQFAGASRPFGPQLKALVNDTQDIVDLCDELCVTNRLPKHAYAKLVWQDFGTPDALQEHLDSLAAGERAIVHVHATDEYKVLTRDGLGGWRFDGEPLKPDTWLETLGLSEDDGEGALLVTRSDLLEVSATMQRDTDAGSAFAALVGWKKWSAARSDLWNQALAPHTDTHGKQTTPTHAEALLAAALELAHCGTLEKAEWRDRQWQPSPDIEAARQHLGGVRGLRAVVQVGEGDAATYHVLARPDRAGAWRRLHDIDMDFHGKPSTHDLLRRINPEGLPMAVL